MGLFVRTKTSGLLLVEIIVVAALIAGLATVVMMNVTGGKEKSYDAQRISDMETLKLAFRLYADKNSGYPKNEFLDDGVVVDSGVLDADLLQYVSGHIEDPLYSPGSEYGYIYDSAYTCGGASRIVLIVLTMQLSSSANYEEVCGGAAEDIGIGITPSEASYIVILRTNS